MKFSNLFFTTALLVAVKVQGDDPSTTDTTTTTTTDEGGPTVTLPPDVCPTAGLESCYNVLTMLEPTVYLILTVTDEVPASLAAEETIASGDPILTQTDNIATGTDDVVDPPRTAVIRISYTESDGTTCDDATTTSTLTTNDPECAEFTTAFNTPPPATTKTRVFIKGRADTEVGKVGPSGGTSDPTPGGGATDTNLPVNTGGTDSTTSTTEAPGSTEEAPTYPTGTTETYPAGSASDTTSGVYDSASDEPSSDTPSYQPTDSNSTPTTTDSPTTLLTSSQGGSSSGDNAGQDEQGKGELTSYTTLAEVTNGVTNYVTKAIATLTSSAGSTSTSSPGPLTGAGSVHTMIIGQVLLGAAGLGVILGL